MTFKCRECEQDIEVPITQEQYHDWEKKGTLIQHEFPSLNADQREIMLSGTCGPCFDAMFSDDDDDEEEGLEEEDEGEDE